MIDVRAGSDNSTLLDSTAAVWFNEMSDGNAHNLNNIPIIHAGGLNGYFKTGQAVNVDTAAPGAATLSNGQSESQCANGTGTVNKTFRSTVGFGAGRTNIVESCGLIFRRNWK